MKVPLNQQQASVQWALQHVEPVAQSLTAQNRMTPEEADRLVTGLRGAVATIAFLQRPDVEVRKRG